MFYVWLCNSWPGIVINFSTIHFSPVWIQIPFTFGSRQRRTSRCACACLRVSSKRRCSSGWWQTISALESRVSLLYWKASCMHPLTLRPAPGSSKMTKGLFPGKVAFILVFYRTVVVHYIYNPNPNPLTLTLALKRILLTLKTLHHLAPSYLSDLLIPHRPPPEPSDHPPLSLWLYHHPDSKPLETELSLEQHPDFGTLSPNQSVTLPHLPHLNPA